MRTNLLLLVLVVLICVGCRTTKQTAKAEAKTVANLDVKQSNESKQAADSTVFVVDKSTSTVYTDELITVTNLSNPDSTGKQWPTQTIVTKRTISNKNAADLNKKIAVNKQNSNKTTLRDKSKYKSDNKSQSETTKETKTPAWVVILILIAALFGVVYFILKRIK